MMDEDEVERIRASRGTYEVEVSCTGELGLHQSKRKCAKNPHHLNFIPVKDFNIDHLPRRYRDDLLVDYVRAQSDLTCRVEVSRISGRRPKTWPNSDQPYPFFVAEGRNCTRIGTGCVSYVYKFTEKSTSIVGACKCDKCLKSRDTHNKTWGQIVIITALHVVYDYEEATHTKCQFFYDSPEQDINKVFTLTRLDIGSNDIYRDRCTLIYITHDMELLDRFDEMCRLRTDLHKKVINKYLRNKIPSFRDPGIAWYTHVRHNLCIIVSHPHGCTKVVTVGVWTHRDVDDNDSIREDITYRYNTPTCTGSSGAAVITMYKEIHHKDYTHPVHSQGRPGNDNSSGIGMEYYF